MENDLVYSCFSLMGFLLTAIGSALLYACSDKQRLFRKTPSGTLLFPVSALLMLLGIAAWSSAWGGLVGGLLALLTWMLTSVALPCLLARRRHR